MPESNSISFNKLREVLEKVLSNYARDIPESEVTDTLIALLTTTQWDALIPADKLLNVHPRAALNKLKSTVSPEDLQRLLSAKNTIVSGLLKEAIEEKVRVAVVDATEQKLPPESPGHPKPQPRRASAITKAPLMAVCVTIGRAVDTEAYSSAFHAAFRDTEVPGFGVTGTLPLLDVSEVRHFNLENRLAFAEWLGGEGFQKICRACERLLVVVVDGYSQGADEGTAPYSISEESAGGLQFVKVVTLFTAGGKYRAEEEGKRFSTMCLGLDDLNERDLQLPFFVLHILRAANALLIATAGSFVKPKIFFSHAKRDGVPLARGSKLWLKLLPGFKSFYDTDDLDLDKDIGKQLSKAVGNSMLVVFRTEVFDQRYWCRQEVLWAEEKGSPLICVDARWQLQHDSSMISFDGSPAVKVPDGSILRILMAILREAFRIWMFDARVRIAAAASNVVAETIPRHPSLLSLSAACKKLDARGLAANGSAKYVVYPNPAMPSDTRTAIANLVEAGSEIRVRSLDEWSLEIQ